VFCSALKTGGTFALAYHRLWIYGAKCPNLVLLSTEFPSLHQALYFVFNIYISCNRTVAKFFAYFVQYL
jgi:hypothetical protein